MSTNLHTMKDGKESDPIFKGLVLFSLKKNFYGQVEPWSWFLYMSLISHQVAGLLNKQTSLFQSIIVSQNLAFEQWAAKCEFSNNFFNENLVHQTNALVSSSDQFILVYGCSFALSCVQLFVIPWALARHTPLSMEFSKQEYWNGLPYPFPRDLTDSGIESESPASHELAGRSFTTASPGNLCSFWCCVQNMGPDISRFIDIRNLKSLHWTEI